MEANQPSVIDIYQCYFLLKRNGARHAAMVTLWHQITNHDTKQTIAIIGATGNMGSVISKSLAKAIAGFY
jgi:hypothetical protein